LTTRTADVPSVTGCDLSYDCARAVSSSRDGSVRIWPARVTADIRALNADGDVAEYASMAQFLDHKCAVNCCSIARIVFSHTPPPGCIFSPDSQRVASGGSDGAILVFDAASRARTDVGGEESPVLAVSYSSRGDVLLTCSQGGDVRVWKGREGLLSKTISKVASCELRACRVSPDDSRVAVGGSDGVFRFGGGGGVR
jgi:WD40 repeat protein